MKTEKEELQVLRWQRLSDGNATAVAILGPDPQMATIVIVKVVFGQALRWQRADFGLAWYKNDVSYCFTRCATHFFPGAHNSYQLLPLVLPFQGQRLQKKAIYTDGYQSVLNVKI